MRSLFSEELIAALQIRLDREGLEGITEKEITALLAGTVTRSTTFVIAEMTSHAEKQTDRLIAHLDGAIAAQTETLVAHIDKQTEKLMKHSEIQTSRIISELGSKIDGLGSQVNAIHQEIQPLRKELESLRFWAKILVPGVWAVVASIIANIIFQVFIR